MQKKNMDQNPAKKETCVPSPKPNKIGEEFQHDNATWRIFRIISEFVEGFQFLSSLRKEISIFGSTRFQPSHHHYKEAYLLGKLLGERGFTIVTGGGPGIMEAANRGAFDSGAESIGLNIQLPSEQRVNPYVKKSIGFHYFFTRKVMLSASAQAYIFFPGGFGTLDEFFEIVTLIQTKKMDPIPVILIGKDFWAPLLKWIEEYLYKKHRAIMKEDMKIYYLVKDIQEAVDLISGTKERSYLS